MSTATFINTIVMKIKLKTLSTPDAGVAESGKGARLRVWSRRGPRVQIPPPACLVHQKQFSEGLFM